MGKIEYIGNALGKQTHQGRDWDMFRATGISPTLKAKFGGGIKYQGMPDNHNLTF